MRTEPTHRARIRLFVGTIVITGFVVALYVLTRPPDHDASAPQLAPGELSRAIPQAQTVDARKPISTDDHTRTSRETLLATIRDPRAGHEPWDETGLALLDQLGRDASDVTDRGCYMAGCIATFTFASDASYRRAIDDLTTSAEYAAWTGGKQITSPETLANGQVVIALVLQRPD